MSSCAMWPAGMWPATMWTLGMWPYCQSVLEIDGYRIVLCDTNLVSLAYNDSLNLVGQLTLQDTNVISRCDNELNLIFTATLDGLLVANVTLDEGLISIFSNVTDLIGQVIFDTNLQGDTENNDEGGASNEDDSSDTIFDFDTSLVGSLIVENANLVTIAANAIDLISILTVEFSIADLDCGECENCNDN